MIIRLLQLKNEFSILGEKKASEKYTRIISTLATDDRLRQPAHRIAMHAMPNLLYTVSQRERDDIYTCVIIKIVLNYYVHQSDVRRFKVVNYYKISRVPIFY